MVEKAATSDPPFFISVLIVNYNGVSHLERCLTSLARQGYPRFETIVVDNASTDGSADWVAEHFPQVHLICSERNLGFAAGNNLGIREARGELIATLNTDTEVDPEYLEMLSAPMVDGQIGMCAPLMLEMDRRGIVDAAGLTVDSLGFAWNVGAGEEARNFTIQRLVFGACAGAALYRRAMLEALGSFDEDYFAYYEDADLAWRAQRSGWKGVFVPGARVYHLHGGSFGKTSPQKSFLLARNRWWTLIKNYPLSAFVLYLPAILGADTLALARATLHQRSSAPLRGRLAAAAGAGRAWRKRNQAR